MLQVDQRHFAAADLSRPLTLGRRFDLAQSLEVGEHLPLAAASTLVDTLVAHAPLVLFSAAVPGQGGEHHINERPHAFWRDLFRERGFCLIDTLRPRLVADMAVAPWYRHNTFVFVDRASAHQLSTDLLADRVPDESAIASYAPSALRIWFQIARWLPPSAMTAVARTLRRLDAGSTGAGDRLG